MKAGGHPLRVGSMLLVLAAVLAGTGGPARAQTSPRQANISMQADVQYGTASGVRLLMDVYTPPGEGPFPALITIHGGGFVTGDKHLQRGVSTQFATDGYVAFAIDYRLAPQYPYPASVEDAKTAVEFVRSHADEFNIDPNRIGLMGSSAGGAIAASVGAQSQPPYTSGARVAAVVSWSGPMDLNRVLAERPDNPAVLRGVPGYVGISNGDATSPADQEKLRSASPINQVKKGIPPMFVANAEGEFVPIDQAMSFADKLEQLGVKVQTLWVPGRAHALHYTRQAIRPSMDFLETYLRNYKGDGPAKPTHSPSPTSTAAPATTPPQTIDTSPASNSSWMLPVLIGVGAVLILGLLGAAYAAGRRRRPYG